MQRTARSVLRQTGLVAALMAAASASAQTPPDCAERAVRLLNAIESGQYAAAEADFSPEMRSALPPEALRSLIEEQLASKLGRLQAIGEGATEIVGASRVVGVPLRFERGALTATVSCDAEGTVTGFHLLPPRPATVAPRQYSPPPYAEPRRYRETTTEVGRLALGATLSMPNGAGPWPAVVLVHGSGPADRDETHGPNKTFADLAAGLATRGIAVLRYDKRTFAHPEAGAKPGFNLDDEVTDDAVAAVARLRGTPGIDPQRVYVLGHSLGGELAPRIALREPALAGLVLLAAPATPFEDGYLRQWRYLADLDGQRSDDEKKRLAETEASVVQLHHLLRGEPVTGPMPLAESGAGPAYLLDWARLDALADAKKAAKPMLILQGDHDYQVSPDSDFGRWRKAFAGDPKTRLILYPGLSHLFRPAGDPPSPADYQTPAPVDARVVDDIARWIGGAALSRAADAGS